MLCSARFVSTEHNEYFQRWARSPFSVILKIKIRSLNDRDLEDQDRARLYLFLVVNT